MPPPRHHTPPSHNTPPHPPHSPPPPLSAPPCTALPCTAARRSTATWRARRRPRSTRTSSSWRARPPQSSLLTSRSAPSRPSRWVGGRGAVGAWEQGRREGGREGGQLLCVAWGMMECSPAVAGRWLAFWKPPMVVAAALSGRRRSGSGISSMCRALTSTCLPPLSPALGCLPALPAGQGADGARVCQGHGRRPAQVHCPGGRGRAVEGHHPAVGPPDPLHNDEVR